MADAIPTTLLGAGAAPAALPLVYAVPTPGCRRHPLLTVNSPLLASTTPTTTPTTTTTTTTTTTVPGTSSPAGNGAGTDTSAGKGPLATGPIGSSSSTPVGLLAALGVLGLGALAVVTRLGLRGRADRRRGR